MRQKKPPLLGKGERGQPSIYGLWPWGAVALMLPGKTEDGRPLIRVRKVELQLASPTHYGFKLWVGPSFWLADEYRVGPDGTSAECVPWDDEIEAQIFPEPKPAADTARETLERMRERDRRRAEEQEKIWGDVDRKARLERLDREAKEFKARMREVERNGQVS